MAVAGHIGRPARDRPHRPERRLLEVRGGVVQSAGHPARLRSKSAAGTSTPEDDGGSQEKAGGADAPFSRKSAVMALSRPRT